MEAYNEFAIEWLKGDRYAKVSAPAGSWVKNKIIKLAELYPDEVSIIAENKDGSIFAQFPVRYLKITRPREVSDEFREAARKRLQAWHAEKEGEAI